MLRSLTLGMRGADVRAVQQGLNEYFRGKRPTLNPDGVFGDHTRAAVDDFQKRNPGTGKPDGSPDSEVGHHTRRKLFPLAVVTVSMVGYRLKMPTLGNSNGIKPPNLGPGPLRFPGTPPPSSPIHFNPNANVVHVDWNQITKPAQLDFKAKRFPNLRLPLPVPPAPLPPRVLDPLPAPGPLTPSTPPSGLFNVASVDHLELSPGTQTVLPRLSQTSFTLALQGVVMIGDDDKAHQEFASGIQVGSATVDGSSPWSVAWYAQITDVDRFGKLGLFHYWQPYAQLGIQTASNSFRPVITGNLFPVNLGFDVNDSLTVALAGGLALTYDPVTGTVVAGAQVTTGFILKFDAAPKKK